MHDRERGLAILRNLETNLGLSVEDLGTMLGLTGDSVRAWRSHEAEIPALEFGKLVAAGSALDQLLGIFRAERLPQVIRRRAAGFDGERALDWILDGRISEVAERYDRGLSYLKLTA
jgi:hypothetical protein